MEKIYEVSVPMFLLPYAKVKASSEEEAKQKYLEEVKFRLDTLFPKNDHRVLDENDAEGWSVTTE